MRFTFFSIGLLVLFSFGFLTADAQELYQDLQGVWRAEVVGVVEGSREVVPGTDVTSETQTLEVRILEGERSGDVAIFENDYIQLEEGDTFYLNYLLTINGDEFYSVREVDRRGAMLGLLLLFVFVVLLFGGMQGLRSLLSLAGSILVITYILVPSLLQGFPPVLTSVLVATLVLFFAIFLTHGFHIRSLVAFIGTVLAVGITGALAFMSVSTAGLTGFSSDEAVYLNLGTGGELDFVGLLLAAMIIGALGVLDDIAVTQVAVVRELYGAGEKFSKWDIYRKAIRVGREHVSALVNTLVLAYTGAALPLLLLFSLSDSSAITILNREIFATEILRAVVGSIGLILTVPITTLLAAFVLEKYRGQKSTATHTHSHL